MARGDGRCEARAEKRDVRQGKVGEGEEGRKGERVTGQEVGADDSRYAQGCGPEGQGNHCDQACNPEGQSNRCDH